MSERLSCREAEVAQARYERAERKAAAYRQALVDYRAFAKEAGFATLAAEITDKLNAADALGEI